MKHILCYGDSNTWGHKPASRERFDKKQRWPGVLSDLLGDDHEVIEEGLNGRTTVWDDPIEGYKNGRDYLIPCLDTHHPLDLVIMMLGTNDLKKRFSLSAFDIAQGAGVLANIILKSNAGRAGQAPALLLIAPPPVANLIGHEQMFEGAEDKSRLFSEQYQRVANELGCAFLDSATIITCSDLDGIHLEQNEHEKLGQAVALKVKSLLG